MLRVETDLFLALAWDSSSSRVMMVSISSELLTAAPPSASPAGWSRLCCFMNS